MTRVIDKLRDRRQTEPTSDTLKPDAARPGQFMQGGYGLVGDIVLGIVGAIVGGYISGLILGRDLMVTGFNLESVVVAFLSAVALIAFSRRVHA